MSNDLTFFTNEPGATLNDRFEKILKHTRFFDILVYELYGLKEEEIKTVEDSVR